MKPLVFTEEQIKKGTELLSRIRTDEGDVLIGCANGEIDYYMIKFFDDGENTGIFLSLLFWGSFRIFIAFEKDTDQYTQELAELIRLTKEKNPGASPSVYFIAEQKILMEGLRQIIAFHPPLPNGFHYASHEFVMDREHFKGFVNDKHLKIKPYEDNKLDDYLLLLDSAMTFASPPPNFCKNKANMSEDLKKKIFEAFYKDGELAGLYWLDNDFYTIEFLAVSPSHQRQGYGSIILSHAIHTVLSDPQYTMAKLYCVDWNAQGLAFYRKFGMIAKGHTYTMEVKS